MQVKSAVGTMVSIAAALAAFVAAARPARALEPAQIGVVVNTASEGSKLVARHYMTVRKIPAGNMLEIAVDPQLRGWSEARYRDAVVAELRKQLLAAKLQDQIRCLVLTYDVPLTVPAVVVPADEKAELGGYEKKLREFYAAIEAGVEEYNAVAAAGAASPATASAPARRDGPPPDFRVLQAAERRLLAAADAAVKRVEKLAPDLRGRAMQNFADTHQKFVGPAGIISAITVADAGPGADATRQRIAQMRDEVSAANRELARLAALPSSVKTRSDIFTLRVKTYGLIGGANQAIELTSRLQPADTSSCLDSELAMLWQDAYPKARWVNNPMSLDQWPVFKDKRLPRMMMVARLDGLTPQAAIKTINTAIETEKGGLDGVAYFDARGIKAPGYEPYDRDLMETAEYLTKNSTMKVVLDKNDTLMQAANSPDAALYCGWYSLRNYQDSCQWKPGAVGFHVASWEMATLHDEKEKGWVSNLLRRGFAGTLGATEEPYLTSFPKPSQFFPLLMCGEFTQGEVYFVTNPWLSWRTGFVGDPLYNPFKAKPKITSEKLKERPDLRRAWEILQANGLGSHQALPSKSPA